MDIRETGIILFCEHYESMLAFYVEQLGLPVRHRGADLAILNFGMSYLMIESGGHASKQKKTRVENPTVLRFDVRDFEAAVQELRSRHVNVEVKSFKWGTIGVIIDPEGNRIELKQ